MPLTYPPFAAVDAIQKASRNLPPLRPGDKGSAVAMVQSGLIDLNYKLPSSTRKTGFPDGIYGAETKQALIRFQTDAKFAAGQIDGVAGKNTILEMDKKLAAKFGATSVIPAPPKPIPIPQSDQHYTVGNSQPTIKPDVGAGIFNSKPVEVSMWALKQSILEILPPRGSSAMLFIGFDAAANMKHYLNTSGADLKINLESMIDSGPTAKGRFRDEISQAKKFVETLPIGTHQISSKFAESAYNYKEESSNWFYAVGGYASWGKGTATVTKGATVTEYSLDFEYHFFDRYNWDGGKSVTIGPITITDVFMGEFHRQGLAREYNMKAMIKRQFKWKKGDAIPEAQYQRGSGR